MAEKSAKHRGGEARAKSLSKQKRSDIAKKAAKTRGDNQDLPQATHGADDHPLCISEDIKIPCYVLSDGRRVLIQRGMASAIGISTPSGTALSTFSRGKILEQFLTKDLTNAIDNPIKFKTTNGAIAHGYDAKILADICDAVLEARKAKKLLPSQEHIATQCEILVRGFARVGIIALIDEATGYQEDRAKNALSKILEAFIAKELQPYIKTFPLDFYKELFRLKGLAFPAENMKNPQYFGHLTNNFIYKRLASGILDQLKKITPISRKGNKTARYFQSLTVETGYPKLKEHLGSVVTLMKLSKNYDEFKELLDRIHPKYSENVLEMDLDLDEDSE
jgi:hypothetical protein